MSGRSMKVYCPVRRIFQNAITRQTAHTAAAASGPPPNRCLQLFLWVNTPIEHDSMSEADPGVECDAYQTFPAERLAELFATVPGPTAVLSHHVLRDKGPDAV